MRCLVGGLRASVCTFQRKREFARGWQTSTMSVDLKCERSRLEDLYAATLTPAVSLKERGPNRNTPEVWTDSCGRSVARDGTARTAARTDVVCQCDRGGKCRRVADCKNSHFRGPCNTGGLPSAADERRAVGMGFAKEQWYASDSTGNLFPSVRRFGKSSHGR